MLVCFVETRLWVKENINNRLCAVGIGFFKMRVVKQEDIASWMNMGKMNKNWMQMWVISMKYVRSILFGHLRYKVKELE